MENTEKTINIQTFENLEENMDESSYSFERHENFTLEGQHELKEVVPESTLGSMAGEAQPSPEEELSAVDLRTTKPLMSFNPIGSKNEKFENKNDDLNMAHSFQNFHGFDFNHDHVSVASQIENSAENANRTICNHTDSYKDDLNPVSDNHCSSHNTMDLQKKYTFKKVIFNGPDTWNTEKNVGFVLLVDQETQTQMKEFKEASMQTDKGSTNKCTFSFLKGKNSSIVKYSCFICQRFYTSKSSYDRHARTHVKNRSMVKPVTNLQMTKKARFMILGGNVDKVQSHTDLPMAIQEPNSTKFQCSICFKSFSSQVARDVHRDSFVLEKFPMTKCKECHMKFFTLGALHEHVNFVHERNSYKREAYCCVFCNESFESSYNFQLHLDEHLTTQIND